MERVARRSRRSAVADKHEELCFGGAAYKIHLFTTLRFRRLISAADTFLLDERRCLRWDWSALSAMSTSISGARAEPARLDELNDLGIFEDSGHEGR
jgi:hypothetical protein